MLTNREEGKKLHELFYKVMEGYEDPRCEVSLHSIMEDVQEFFWCSYMLGINPLRELRNILPQYVWRYHNLSDKREVREAVSHSDFVWRLNWLDDDSKNEADKIELVTATSTDTTAPPWGSPEYKSNFWVGVFLRKEVHPRAILARQIRFARKHGGEPVYVEIVNV